MKMNLQSLVKTREGRVELMSALCNREYYDKKESTHKDDYWQCVPTPMNIVERMIAKVDVLDGVGDDLSGRDILVMFNPEFLEALVMERGIDGSRITFLADNEVLKDMAERVYGVETMYLPKADHNVKGLVAIMANKKFDLVFSNPPYNGNVDLKILKELVPLAKEIVVVHPSTWLIDRKMKSKLYNDFRDLINGKLKSAELFNGNPVFNIGLFVPVVITHINNDYSGNCEVKYFAEEYVAHDVYEVSKFGVELRTIVEPFMGKVKEAINLTSSMWSNRISRNNIDRTKYHLQLSGKNGNWANTQEALWRDNFHTIVRAEVGIAKGIRKEDITDENFLVWEFSTEEERDNLLSYIQTDFARFCLAYYKNTDMLKRGELEIIPWLDLTQSWDDEKLYKHFGIDGETQEYIREFLPDFHGIRK